MATLNKTENWFSSQLLFNAGQRYCRMLQWEHSAVLLTFIKIPLVIDMFVVFVFEWPFYTGFTVYLTKLDGRFHHADLYTTLLNFNLLICSIPAVSIYFSVWKTLWILITWLCKKPADLDLHCSK